MNKKTILMTVGSSGGHIYPAVAVAENLEAQLEQLGEKQGNNFEHFIEIHFVHSGSLLGKNIFTKLKYPVHEIPVGRGLAKGQSFRNKLKTLLSLPKAFIQSFLLIKKLKPEVILGTGGAITGPVLMSAFFMGRKTALWEGNAVLGLTNKWLSPFVSCVFTVFPIPGSRFQKKQILCSYPLRNKFCKTIHQDFASKNNSQQKEKKAFKVLVLGGSQGSFLLNQVVSDSVQEEAWRKDIFIYHQTGTKQFDLLKEKYKTLQNIKPFPFSLNIEEYYQTCDLIFSRAGSGAIWETASYKKALVLIPLTSSAGGHQLKNASELASQNCVKMIQEKNFHVNSFKDTLLQLKTNKEKREQLAQSLYNLHKGNGAKQIADWLLSNIVLTPISNS